jgi:hypothetical protein
MSYRLFTRTWFKENSSGKLEPCAGRQYTHGHVDTIEQARAACKAWNDAHKPGRLSKKMEFTHAHGR